MVPERGSHAVINSLISVMVSHVLFLHVLKILDLEVAPEVEPEMHGIVKYLRDPKARHEA